MLSPLDGPSAHGLLSLTTGTVTVAKVGATAHPERKVITLQPLDGKIRVFFGGEGAAPSAATVVAQGFRHPKNAVRSYEASDSQVIYLTSETGTVSVVIAERA